MSINASVRQSVLAPILKKHQLGDATKNPETGRNGRQKGRFFSSRPVTWCGLAQFPVNRPGFVSQPIQNHLYLAVELRTGRPTPLKCRVQLRFPGSTHRIVSWSARFAWPLTFAACPNRVAARRRAAS